MMRWIGVGETYRFPDLAAPQSNALRRGRIRQSAPAQLNSFKQLCSCYRKSLSSRTKYFQSTCSPMTSKSLRIQKSTSSYLHASSISRHSRSVQDCLIKARSLFGQACQRELLWHLISPLQVHSVRQKRRHLVETSGCWQSQSNPWDKDQS
jgi:hypothetical protein